MIITSGTAQKIAGEISGERMSEKSVQEFRSLISNFRRTITAKETIEQIVYLLVRNEQFHQRLMTQLDEWKERGLGLCTRCWKLFPFDELRLFYIKIWWFHASDTINPEDTTEELHNGCPQCLVQAFDNAGGKNIGTFDKYHFFKAQQGMYGGNRICIWRGDSWEERPSSATLITPLNLLKLGKLPTGLLGTLVLHPQMIETPQ